MKKLKDRKSAWSISLRRDSAKLTPFNAYVALSRSSGQSTIRLLRDFDDHLFTTIPCPMLAAEDERVEGLDQRTKEWWESVEKGLSQEVSDDFWDTSKYTIDIWHLHH